MNSKEGITARKIFLQTIKSIINCDEKPYSIKELDIAVQRKLYVMALRHDLAHLISKECIDFGYITDTKIKELFKKQQILSVYRYERMNFEYQEIKQTLIKEKIPFLPLKGLIIRELYQEPWMRTSCDIDVLVQKEDLKRAIDALKKENKYVQQGAVNYHDVSLYAPSQVHLELHFNIKENIEYIDKLLEKVWEYSIKIDENGYEYRQSNEFFIFHIIAHLLYHFKSGGCGVRPLIDLYLLHKNFELDQEKLKNMFDECGIYEFYEQIKKLSEVWFSDREHTELTEMMEEYIFSGGVYGSKENDFAVKKNIVNRKKYILNRIFSPYDVIKNRYPILQKHKWLTPFYQVRRWTETIFSKKAGKLKEEIQIYDSVDADKKANVEKMFSGLGIKI